MFVFARFQKILGAKLALPRKLRSDRVVSGLRSARWKLAEVKQPPARCCIVELYGILAQKQDLFSYICPHRLWP